jgi:hypothetical protein
MSLLLAALACQQQDSREALLCLWECPHVICDVHLGLDMADIEACYDTPEHLPELLVDCAGDWGEAVCSLSIDRFLDASLVDSPVWSASLGEADGFCDSLNEWEPAPRPEGDSLDELLREVDRDCPIEVSSAWLGGCRTPPEFEPEPLGECEIRPLW